jgi:hypothetical protein
MMIIEKQHIETVEQKVQGIRLGRFIGFSVLFSNRFFCLAFTKIGTRRVHVSAKKSDSHFVFKYFMTYYKYNRR